MTGEEWRQALTPVPRFIRELGLEEEAHDFQVAGICLCLGIQRATDSLNKAIDEFVEYLND